MKIKRYKHARRYLGFYKNLFNFQEPHLVLVDGTFTCMALRHKTNIQEQLPKYLGGNIQLMTTKCAIVETESLGKELFGAAAILKRYKILKCPHREKPVPGADCFTELIGEENKQHYYIATQDPELTEHVHTIPGIPLLYMNMNAIVLEKPSKASNHFAEKLTKKKTKPSAVEKETLKQLKGTEEKSKVERQKKRRRPKEPNPLSVKRKKKNKSVQETPKGAETAGRRKRRNRSKVAKHIREQMRTSDER
ncbi:rRNA-processing protein UTP23 homolog [Asterias amurensis]|uniref:rRNA-processing protein UTP23 homolog n=1 Tax=Asterias amurensis TaxID=7602 RepID=UPI003AB15E04